MRILSDHRGDFTIRHEGKILVQQYDYYSVMHYKTTAFSVDVDNLRTMEILQDGINEEQVGQREFLSTYDKKRIRLLYGCDKSRRNLLDTQTGQEQPNPVPSTNPGENHTPGEVLPGHVIYSNGDAQTIHSDIHPTIFTDMFTPTRHHDPTSRHAEQQTTIRRQQTDITGQQRLTPTRRTSTFTNQSNTTRERLSLASTRNQPQPTDSTIFHPTSRQTVPSTGSRHQFTAIRRHRPSTTNIRQTLVTQANEEILMPV